MNNKYIIKYDLIVNIYIKSIILIIIKMLNKISLINLLYLLYLYTILNIKY
jgi:hypothetical protein